jgi:hypothetical protein
METMHGILKGASISLFRKLRRKLACACDLYTPIHSSAGSGDRKSSAH